MRGATVKKFNFSISTPISIHAPHAGSDVGGIFRLGADGISIHAPHAGSDIIARRYQPDSFYFNPRSPCGERPLLSKESVKGYVFQSTLPMRGATQKMTVDPIGYYISIHAPHAGSDEACTIEIPVKGISIHAPHAGSDDVLLSMFDADGISIHAPHAGSDDTHLHAPWCIIKFQSTLPMRGATRKMLIEKKLKHNFNPRSPCGERPNSINTTLSAKFISIHAPHAGSDGIGLQEMPLPAEFQSTLPMRGATVRNTNTGGGNDISIHAPHAGSDT